MTPNNHPPFDAPGDFCNDETMEKAWQYVEETKANGYVFHSETEAVVAFEIGMFHQYKKDLRTMIPREKVEKLLETLRFIADKDIFVGFRVATRELAYKALKEFEDESK